MNAEKKRLEEKKTKAKHWLKWGPYLTERQWGTVREDYSANGDAWNYITHDDARSKTYRWGEEGIGGISDDQQLLCFSVALWNKRDPILKERLFGLTGQEANHGEDVKEYYYYLDSTPTHSYMKMLYKYPQQEFPYRWLIEENKRRNRFQPEFELVDTGVFNDDKYFDVFMEYAKNDIEDMLIRITVHNRGNDAADLCLLPHLWFRNTWAWGYDDYKPTMFYDDDGCIKLNHRDLGAYYFYYERERKPDPLFCENETNVNRLYNVKKSGVFKDGINDYVVHGNRDAVHRGRSGTKAALNYALSIPAKSAVSIKLRLCTNFTTTPFEQFDQTFSLRLGEADEFYGQVQGRIGDKDEKNVQRQAFAGMMWTKQFYYYDVLQWFNGDPAQPKPPAQRRRGRNREWMHLNNAEIISMPDKWEYPWYAAWDSAFHCIPIAMIDHDFAKEQLILFTEQAYMHPNGQLPAYEWNFGDVNPPVHAWATWRVYNTDKKRNGGKGDLEFLKTVYHKMLLNFTWWVNRKDFEGNNIFQGGFLGLDNIGVFDRSATLPTGGHIEQADGTSWMAMYSLNMMRIAIELSQYDATYQGMATKFFEHFLFIAGALANISNDNVDLWDEEDQFFYDVLHIPHRGTVSLKVRSLVGLTPMFAVEVLDDRQIKNMPDFAHRMQWFLNYRSDLARLVSRWQDKNVGEQHLLSLLRGHRLKRLLKRMLDETEFLSDYGVRSLSRYHEKHPYTFYVNGEEFKVNYQPSESESAMFGGNSNWRGPIWFPMNYMLITSLYKFHAYYGNEFKVEHPTGSGKYHTLAEIAFDLSKRLTRIFLLDEHGRRPVFGNYEKFQSDPHFRDYVPFYEYFHGNTGQGLGASHQTGWTGLIAKLLDPLSE
jgi:hypothetical protein